MKKTNQLSDDRFNQYSYYCAHTRRGFRPFVLLWKFLSLTFKKHMFEGKMEGLVFFASTTRNDHLLFLKAVFSCCNIKKSYLELITKKCINFKFVALFFINIFKCKNFKHIKLFDEKVEKGFIIKKTSVYERLCIYMDYIDYVLFDRLLDKICFNNIYGCVVLYDTCHPERNFVRKMNKLQKTSITLCHGIFNPHIDYKQESFLNYWNSDASYSLTWGEGTSRLFNIYSPSTKSIVCGNPIINPINQETSSNYIGVVFSVGSLNIENQKMIEIVQQFARKNNFKIHIRIHPGDNIKNYSIDNKICLLEKELDSDCFIIAHTSAMLYMYLAQGKKVLKYIGATPTYKTDSRISFNTLLELEDRFNNLNLIDFSSISKFEIELIGDESKKMYQRAFDYIAKKEGFINE